MRPNILTALAELDPQRLARERAVLLIEDSDGWAEEITQMFADTGGWQVRRAADRRSAEQALGERRYDLMVIDRNLEPDDGLELLADLRSQGLRTPAIMLTTMGEAIDIVDGLRRGGDDYVVKPPRPDEFMARVAALMRRADGDGKLVFGLLEVNFSHNCVLWKGRALDMNQREMNVLAYLALRNPELVSMEELLSTVWRYRPVLWADGVTRIFNPGGLADVAFSVLRGDLARAGAPEGFIRAYPAAMSSENFAALALDKAEAVLARNLTKRWSLDAAAAQMANT